MVNEISLDQIILHYGGFVIDRLVFVKASVEILHTATFIIASPT
jgi:hypothetical protein